MSCSCFVEPVSFLFREFLVLEIQEMGDDEISAHFIHDVIGVNVFHFTLMRFHFEKRDNSVPILLLPSYLSKLVTPACCVLEA